MRLFFEILKNFISILVKFMISSINLDLLKIGVQTDKYLIKKPKYIDFKYFILTATAI